MRQIIKIITLSVFMLFPSHSQACNDAQRIKNLCNYVVNLIDGSPKTQVSNFLFRIAIVESQLKYRTQIGGGTALGLWQMEPKTCIDTIKHSPDLKTNHFLLRQFGLIETTNHECIKYLLENSDIYGCIMARLYLKRFKEPIPNSLQEQGEYYEKYYNRGGNGLSLIHI